MSMTMSSEAEQAQRDFEDYHALDIEAIDETVDYFQSEDDTWFPAATIRVWPEVIDSFLASYSEDGMPTTSEALELAEAVLRHGTYEGKRIDVDYAHHKTGGWNYRMPRDGKSMLDTVNAYSRRLFFAQLAADSPDDFTTLLGNDVFATHATQGIVLPSILAQGGLLSHHEQDRRGVPTGAGEQHPAGIRRQFISFGSLGSYAGRDYLGQDLRSKKNMSLLKDGSKYYEGYALRRKEIAEFDLDLQEQLGNGGAFLTAAEAHRFGISFGLSRSALWMAGNDPAIGRKVEVQADSPEFAFAHEVSLDYLPVLGVPQEHHELIARFIENTQGHPIPLFSTQAVRRAREDARYREGKAQQLWESRRPL